VRPDELEGVLHEPAPAPVLRPVAVDQLLLRQGHQSPRPDGVDALHGHHGRERPAAAALALVLDTRDRAHQAPVHGPRQVREAIVHEPRHGRGAGLLPAQVVDARVGERGAELVAAHVAEVVEPEAVGAVAVLVVPVDEVHVVLKMPKRWPFWPWCDCHRSYRACSDERSLSLNGMAPQSSTAAMAHSATARATRRICLLAIVQVCVMY
jgi:hypothetical protein